MVLLAAKMRYYKKAKHNYYMEYCINLLGPDGFLDGHWNCIHVIIYAFRILIRQNPFTK